ncbi:hypothetical protein Z043_117857 [Scleropages formosus]|uniref:Ig-like domain-containing protein n=1 Tax=Scleropages formosus TaxID=113540 RepID=A0A0N8JXI7_SCLFO|nr:hypothetical protein Z043_117857 [Scleropages formosus]
MKINTKRTQNKGSPSSEKMFLCPGGVLLSMLLVVAAQRKVLQDKLSLTKSKGKTVSIPCSASGLQSNEFVHWYQKKEGEPFKRILYINYGSKSFTLDNSHPQKDDFSSDVFNLKISVVKEEHAATYYCACWDYHKSKPPTVTTYIPSKPHENKASLLCVATDMYPNVVKFIWEKKDGNDWKNVPSNEMRTLQQEEESRVSSIMIIDNEKAERDTYSCKVQHEKDPNPSRGKRVPKKSDLITPNDPNVPKPSCVPKLSTPPSNTSDEIRSFKNPNELTNLNMVTFSYSVMILKSMMYFGVVSMIMYKRSGRSLC